MEISSIQNDLLQRKTQLWGSLLLFTQTFYKIRTGRDFLIGAPLGRESHYISMSRELTKLFRLQISDLGINIPPRYGKTELLIHFIAWALARYPDCNFLYLCYSRELAQKATQTIREIITLPLYRQLFGVQIKEDVDSKHNFETTAGGAVYASGTAGTITGRGAGIKGVLDRFSGCMIIDDPIKPDEATSDTVREGVNNWMDNTAWSRLNNGDNTPIVAVGQRTHESELFAKLYKDEKFPRLILSVIDVAGNALCPTTHDLAQLLKMKERSPYVFAAQYMQDPQPAGGGIFKPEWIYLTDDDPEILYTFITADTAETEKTYNDATVFSFWGLYKINDFNIPTAEWALHWIDCLEIRVEPHLLESEFMAFYTQCARYKLAPKSIAIEKKSTGVTLISSVKKLRGIEVIDIERNTVENIQRHAVSKTERFLVAQPYLAQRQISMPRYGKHTHQVLEHLRKITANNSHRFDDIADTMADAIQIGLIDQRFKARFGDKLIKQSAVVNKIGSHYNNINNLRNAAWHG